MIRRGRLAVADAVHAHGRGRPGDPV